MEDYNDINIINEIVKHCCTYNPTISWKWFESFLFIEYNNSVMIIYNKENTCRTSTINRANRDDLIDLCTNRRAEYYRRCRFASCYLKHWYYSILVGDICRELVVNNLQNKIRDEICLLMYQK